MDILIEALRWIAITIGAGMLLVIGSFFVGLALAVIRTLWITAGDDSAETPEKKPYTKLRRDG